MLVRLRIDPVGSAKAANRHGKIGTNPARDRSSLVQQLRNQGKRSGMALPKSALAGLAILVVAITAARAQQSPMPEELARKLLEIGRVIDPPKTVALYAPLQQKEPYHGVKVERDVKYGAADRNLLDVFMPETAASPRPVLIYVHAGAFVGGNKRTTPTSPFYDNIMLWAVKNGFVGVNINYRLAPQAAWPAGAEDMATAVQWVTDRISERGGSPARIYLMGHSAGAVHVANYVSHPEFHKVKGGGRLFRRRSRALRGAILAAGVGDDRHPADAGCRRTRSGRLRAAIRSREAGHLQASERVRPRDPVAAAQSYVGGVFDQHRGHASDRRDSRLRQVR
jgi:hypothetical protein